MARSIIDIDVNDEKFKAFMSLYERYQSTLEKTASKWNDADKSVDAMASSMADMTAAMMAQVEMLNAENHARRQAEREEDAAAKRQREGEKQAARIAAEREKSMKRTAESAKSFAGSIAKATGNIFKWVGIGGLFSGLAGAGGLWGLDRLASSVGDARRSAMGLGTTTGRMQAFGVNFGPYLSPDHLNRIAEAQTSLGDRWAFNVLGVANPQNADPAELAARMAPQAKRLFEAGGRTKEYADAIGLTRFYSMEELRRLSNTSMEELRATAKAYRRDAATMGQTDAVSRRWQVLAQQMDRAKLQIKAAFVDGLAPLAPQFERLSSKLADFIRQVLGSDKFKQAIDGAADKLSQFADYLGSPKFQADMKTFAAKAGEVADNLSMVAEGLVKALRWLRLIPGQSAQDIRAGAYDKPGAAQVTGALATGRIGQFAKQTLEDQQKAQSRTMAFFMGKGWSKEQAAGIVSNLWSESALNPHAVGDKGRAYGVAQWHPDRQAAFKRAFGKDIRDASYEEQLEFVHYELTKGDERKAGDRLRQTHDADEAGKVISKYYERPKFEWAQGLLRGAQAERLAKMKFDQASPAAANDNKAEVAGILSELRLIQKRNEGRTLADLVRAYEGNMGSRADLAAEIRKVSGETGVKQDQTVKDDATLRRIATAIERQQRERVTVYNATGGSAAVSVNQVAQ